MKTAPTVILSVLAAWVVAQPPAGAHSQAACKCPDLQAFYADQMAQRDQERAARRLPNDRPEAKKPARPDSDDE